MITWLKIKLAVAVGVSAIVLTTVTTIVIAQQNKTLTTNTTNNVAPADEPQTIVPHAIEPGIAVGSVHSGMTMQQVIAKLGQPDQTNDSVLVYSHLGLQVAPGNGGVVHRVTVEHPFAGRTKEGIGIGSNRADVIRAFGEPTVAKPGTSGYEFLRYGELGLVFQLHDGKVDMFSLFFQAAK